MEMNRIERMQINIHRHKAKLGYSHSLNTASLSYLSYNKLVASSYANYDVSQVIILMSYEEDKEGSEVEKQILFAGSELTPRC